MARKTVVPNEVLLDGRLTLWHLKVLIALYSFKGAGDEVWPTREKIAERCGGMHIVNISKVTADLVKMGWVSKVGRKGKKATRYRLHAPQEVAESTTSTPPQEVAESTTARAHQEVAESTTQEVAESATPIELTTEQTIQAADAACSACAQPPAPACEREDVLTTEPEFALQACEGKPITQRQARVRGTFVTMERPQEVGEQVWADWIAHRRNQKTPVAITATSMSYTYAEAKKAGISVEQALIYAMQFGWRNFTAAYFFNRVKGQIDAVAMADKSPLETDYAWRMRKKYEQVCPDIAAKPPALPVEAAALALPVAPAAGVPALAAPAGDVVDAPARVQSADEFFRAEGKRLALEQKKKAERQTP